MKKNYSLKIFTLSLIMFTGFSVSLFSQINLPFQSDFSGVEGSSANSSGSNTAITATTMPAGFLYEGSQRIYAGGQKLRLGTAADPGTLPTDVINTDGAATIEVKFYAISWPSTGTNSIPSAKVIVSYGDEETEFTVPLGAWPIEASDLVECSYQFTGISTPTSIIFKTAPYVVNENGARVFFDNVTITAGGTSNQVKNPTFSPGSGTYNTPQNVTINCATEGATIHYTTDNSTPTTSSEIFSTPISIATTTTIKAIAVKADMDPSAVASATYTFPQGVTTLSELRALAPAYNNGSNQGSTVYTYTGHAVITQKKISTASNAAVTMYIQDETAAIMVYDVPKNLQTDLEIGDEITNVSGTLTNYYGMVELIPNEKCNVVNIGKQVPTTIITADLLDNNHERTIQAKVVTIKDVIYTQTGKFEKNNYYHLKENNIVYDSVVYVEFLFDTDYIDDPLPSVAVNINGVINFKGGQGIETRNRIVPLDKSNNIILSITNINKSVIALAPNPANSFVNIMVDSQMKLEVYGILGNLMATDYLYEGNNTISVSNFPAGLYVMKLTDRITGQTYMQKLVVQ